MISRIGFGAEQLGGHAWGNVDPTEASNAVRLAIERGINFFDTADCYGLGYSEELLGKALAGVRDKAIIATKFGVRFRKDKSVFYDNHPDWIDQSLEGSIRRLNTDHIDLYQVHYWDGTTPQERLFGHLEQKRAEGKIRYYGVSNMMVEDPSAWPGLITFSFGFSLIERKYEEAIAKGIGDELTFIGYGSLAQGLLTGKYNKQSRFDDNDRRRNNSYKNFQGRLFLRNLNLVEKIREISSHYAEATVAQVAIAWLLRRFDRSCALVGIKTQSQLKNIIGAAGLNLTEDDFAILDAISGPDDGSLEKQCL